MIMATRTRFSKVLALAQQSTTALLALACVLGAAPASAQAPSRSGSAEVSRGSHHHRHARRRRVNMRAYREAVRSWHDASRLTPAVRTGDGRLVLRLYSINTRARAEMVPQRVDGGFDQTACEQFARVLIDARTRETHEIDPRLMDVVYRIADHFNAPQVSVISGYRAGSRHSNHARGRAVDLLIPGVSDRELADYARSFEGVGVGIYPISGFVHVDVRDRNTYWVDYSGPGSRSRRHARRHHHRYHHRRHAER